VVRRQRDRRGVSATDKGLHVEEQQSANVRNSRVLDVSWSELKPPDYSRTAAWV
jgi:hypothetical protein